MEEAQMLDALAQFNREKILERPVHAKGAGAYGEFEVTHRPLLCRHASRVGKKTRCVTRFSTTGLERGSSEGVRDLKGMATKFFTEQGEWDWVCLNFPFFFFRDAAKFPGLMHAQRRDPQTNLLNPNMLWGWVTDNHEPLHMVLLQFSEFGTMFSWRSLSGYLSHAYKWVMPDGSFKYVHLFLSADRGPNFTDGSQSAAHDDTDPDYATRELYNAIERGDYPTWTANVQVVDPRDAPKLGFNILDVTKHWNLGTYPKSLEIIPSRPFGKLTLNSNVKDYLTEVEKLAFSPSNMVPGVERYRLGRGNDSVPPKPAQSSNTADLGPEFRDWVSQVSSKAWSGPHENDYRFAGEFYAVLPEFRSQEFQDRMVREISRSVAQTSHRIRKKVYATFELVHPELAQRVRNIVKNIVVEGAATASGHELETSARL
ncbi:catalase-like domain-containing protein [Aspergillus terricola var. indicus]